MALPDPNKPIKQRLGMAVSDGYTRAYFGEIRPSNCVTSEKLRRALEAQVAAWRNVANNHLRRMSDPTVPEAGRLKSSAQYAKKALARAEEERTTALAAAEEHLDAIEREIVKKLQPPNSVGQVAIDSEIRAHVRSLRPKERLDFLSNAPAEVKRAIVSAPAMLSGVADETHARFKVELLDAEAPGFVERGQSIADAIGQVKRAAAALDDHSRDLIDFRSAEE